MSVSFRDRFRASGAGPQQFVSGESSDSTVFQRLIAQIKKVLAVRDVLALMVAQCIGIPVIRRGDPWMERRRSALRSPMDSALNKLEAPADVRGFQY